MRLQMSKGTDEIGHGPNKYIVNNETWQVDVPDHVGVVLLATGSGAVRIDSEDDPEDFVTMRHPKSPLSDLTSRKGVHHNEGGVVHVPAVCVVDAIRAGFILAE